MIIPEKKKAVSVILSRLHPDGHYSEGGEVKPEQEIDEHDESLKAIAADIIEALHSKSAHDLMVSLKAFLDECEMHEEE